MRKNSGFTLIELLIVVAIIGIIAAIAIPSLLRARMSANEAAAIGDTRTVITAEAAYHAAHSAFYGHLPCLYTPCVPGYVGPSFLDATLATFPVTKLGYARTFVGEPSGGGANGIPGALNTYCYQSTPASSSGGVRSFGGDLSGIVYGSNAPADCCAANGMANTAVCSPIR
ncbi:MAG: prepilin-type N-terminal cleavage/methylation domain-containing protein [Microvirga sp.]